MLPKRLTAKELREELNNYEDDAEVYFNANGEIYSVTEVSESEVLNDNDIVLV